MIQIAILHADSQKCSIPAVSDVKPETLAKIAGFFMKQYLKKPAAAFKTSITLVALCLLAGCKSLPLLNPKGPIEASERFDIVVAFMLMLIIVIPVIIMTIWFSWTYRVSNTKAAYRPNWSRSRAIELLIWAVPGVIVAILSVIVWNYTHRLDPYKPIAASGSPLIIQVVSLDWKWLFIYPDQNIALVNEVRFPEKVPLQFIITSATVMASFFIPELGSQMIAMAGMQTRLNLLANRLGVFRGQNQQFSGRGYADMQFKAIANSQPQFEEWVRLVKQSGVSLDMGRFKKIAKPGIQNGVLLFSPVETGLFDSVLKTFVPSMRMNATNQTPVNQKP